MSFQQFIPVLQTLGILFEEEYPALQKKISKLERVAELSGATTGSDPVTPSVEGKLPGTSVDVEIPGGLNSFAGIAMLDIAASMPNGIVSPEDAIQVAQQADLYPDFQRKLDEVARNCDVKLDSTRIIMDAVAWWNGPFRDKKLANDPDGEIKSHERWTAALFQSIGRKPEPLRELLKFTMTEEERAGIKDGS